VTELTRLPAVRPGSQFHWGGEVATVLKHMAPHPRYDEKVTHYVEVLRADGRVATIKATSATTVQAINKEEEPVR
jgi:hypothetical protein